MSERDFYLGRILRVDLSTGKITKELFDPQLLRTYIGGVGIGVKIMYDEVPPNVAPFDPENKLVFATGPLTGSLAPGSGTYNVVTKGPLTNLLGSAQANGYFGARMRFAGYDVIIIEGVSPNWVYLWIHDGEVELRSADGLLGLDTWDTEDKVKEELGDRHAVVASIGPPGEHLVKFAGICNDKGHIAATNGPGAVMGSKKLKAIAVNGPMGIPAHDAEKIKATRPPWLEEAKSTSMALDAMGTCAGVSFAAETGWLPVRNLTTNVFPEHELFNGDYLREHFKHTPKHCWACSFNHCHFLEIMEGKYAGTIVEEPELEDMTAWGSLIGNIDPAAGLVLHGKNDRLGMDVKEAGFTIALAIECFEKGLIGLKDTDGLELRWGNAEAVSQLLDNIANRHGFGNILAEGTKRAAEMIGGDAPNYAVFTKRGISPHVHDPRGMWMYMLNQSFSDMGSMVGGDLEISIDPDIGFPNGIPSYTPEIADGVAASGARRQFEDTLCICQFPGRTKLQFIVDVLNAATGWDFSVDEGLTVGRRVINLMRAYSIRSGVKPEEDDTISPRMRETPKDGPIAGTTIMPLYNDMRNHYYDLMGWDRVTSKPLPETLKKLSLDSIIRDLWN